jgi:hypothetical protein
VAPQSRTTNGRSRRGDCSWMASATRSLPTPVSPVTSAVASVAATRAIASNNRRITGEAPIIPAKCGSRHSGKRAASARAANRTALSPTASVAPGSM